MNETSHSTAPTRRWRKRLIAAALFVPVVWCGYEIASQQIALRRGAHLGIEARYAGVTVNEIDFAGSSSFGDDDWDALAEFRDIRRLDLTLTQVTSRSLGNIEYFPHLTELFVLVSQITADQERRLSAERPRLSVTKYHLIDGFRVVDGYQ